MFKLVVATEKVAAAAARCGGRESARERDEQKEGSGAEINKPLLQPDSVVLTVH